MFPLGHDYFDYKLVQVTDKACAKKHGVDSGIVFFRSKAHKFVYDGGLDIPQFKDWIVPRVIDMPF